MGPQFALYALSAVFIVLWAVAVAFVVYRYKDLPWSRQTIGDLIMQCGRPMIIVSEFQNQQGVFIDVEPPPSPAHCGPRDPWPTAHEEEKWHSAAEHFRKQHCVPKRSWFNRHPVGAAAAIAASTIAMLVPSLLNIIEENVYRVASSIVAMFLLLLFMLVFFNDVNGVPGIGAVVVSAAFPAVLSLEHLSNSTRCAWLAVATLTCWSLSTWGLAALAQSQFKTRTSIATSILSSSLMLILSALGVWHWSWNLLAANLAVLALTAYNINQGCYDNSPVFFDNAFTEFHDYKNKYAIGCACVLSAFALQQLGESIPNLLCAIRAAAALTAGGVLSFSLACRHPDCFDQDTRFAEQSLLAHDGSHDQMRPTKGDLVILADRGHLCVILEVFAPGVYRVINEATVWPQASNTSRMSIGKVPVGHTVRLLEVQKPLNFRPTEIEGQTDDPPGWILLWRVSHADAEVESVTMEPEVQRRPNLCGEGQDTCYYLLFDMNNAQRIYQPIEPDKISRVASEDLERFRKCSFFHGLRHRASAVVACATLVVSFAAWGCSASTLWATLTFCVCTGVDYFQSRKSNVFLLSAGALLPLLPCVGCPLPGIAGICLLASVVVLIQLLRAFHMHKNFHYEEELYDMIFGPPVGVLALAWWVSCFCFLLSESATGDINLIMLGNPGDEAASSRIRSLLQMARKIPLWLQVVVSFLKPYVLTSLFGVPKTGQDAKPKPLTLYGIGPLFALMTMMALYTDFRNILRIIEDVELNAWQQVCALTIVFAISSNVQTAIAFVTLLLNYYASVGDLGGAIQRMCVLQGRLWLVTMSITAMLYLPVMFDIACFLFPVFLLYFWIMVPVLGILYYYASYVERQMAQEGCIAGVLGSSQAASEIRLPLVEEEGDAEWKQYAIKMIPLTPVMGAFVPVAVPVLARFIMGVGYFPSAWDTFEDRHVTDFLHTLISTSSTTISYVGSGAQMVHLDKLMAVCALTIAWLQALNYII